MALIRIDDEGLFTITDPHARFDIREAEGGRQVVVSLDGAQLRLCVRDGPNSGSIGDVKICCYETALKRVLRGVCSSQGSLIVRLDSPRGAAYVVIPRCSKYEPAEVGEPWLVLGGNAQSLQHVAHWEPEPVVPVVSARPLSVPSCVPANFVLESFALFFCALGRMMKARWVGWSIRWTVAGLLWGLIGLLGVVGFSTLVILSGVIFVLGVPFALAVYPLFKLREQMESVVARRKYR